ncbi:unannotated protein [freshwater metagenome]|uniref:Unannotated protein n=1 Tax=freshwater metagenome TaxID=449393 RepID=A0A6J7ED56_9ZZZZ|nr:DUF3093 family protein [Actinomycetota bacterium]MSY93655.1 DUF3093 family protein [Actinomycetota bacterium]
MRFREVIAPPVWLLAFIYFLFTSISISLWAAIGNNPALWSQIILTVALVFIAVRSRMIIEIDENVLRIDDAHIELKYLGDVTILDADEMRLVRGRDADPAAFLAIRFWSSRGVLVGIKDHRDPTPYWLISSKRGKELAAVLR